jgi:hypothetical protein
LDKDWWKELGEKDEELQKYIILFIKENPEYKADIFTLLRDVEYSKLKKMMEEDAQDHVYGYISPELVNLVEKLKKIQGDLRKTKRQEKSYIKSGFRPQSRNSELEEIWIKRIFRIF